MLEHFYFGLDNFNFELLLWAFNFEMLERFYFELFTLNFGMLE
jgi:hypothetical protein